MNMAIKIRTPLFSRQPLSAFDKLNFVSFLGSTVASALLAISIGPPSNGALIIVATALLVCTFLALIGLRWMPLLLTVISGIFLYQIANQPFVTYHLTNPKGTGGGEFLAFVLDVFIIAFIFMALVASIGAAVQNFRKGERRAPHWLSSVITGIVGVVIGSLLIAAIAQPITTTSTAATTTNDMPTVHMGPGSFLQSSVTVAKGSKVLLVDDISSVHILTNGTWQNGTAKAEKETGAPTIDNVQVSGKSIEIGPFTTAGIYHIYCTIHQGMNLTVIVP